MKKVEKQIHKIQKELAPRLNYIDQSVAISNVTYSNAQVVTQFITGASEGIAQGISQGERQGDAVFVKSLHIRFLINGSSQSVLPTSYVRIVIFRAKREDQILPTVTDLFYPNTNSVAAIYAPYYWEEHKKYVFLYDKVHTVGASYVVNSPPLIATQIQPGQPIGKYLKIDLKINHKCQYALNNTGAEDGGIYMFIMGDQPAYGASVNWYSRVFYDM